MPKASRAARRLSAEPVPTSKSRESEAAMVNGQLPKGIYIIRGRKVVK